MAAYFSNTDDKTIAQAYVGGSFNLTANVGEVYFAQLDGDELEHGLLILGRLSVPKHIFTFVGDDAKMIYMNWN